MHQWAGSSKFKSNVLVTLKIITNSGKSISQKKVMENTIFMTKLSTDLGRDQLINQSIIHSTLQHHTDVTNLKKKKKGTVYI